MTEHPDRNHPDGDPSDPLTGSEPRDEEKDQDAGPASEPRGAAAHETAEDDDPDAGPASEPRET